MLLKDNSSTFTVNSSSSIKTQYNQPDTIFSLLVGPGISNYNNCIWTNVDDSMAIPLVRAGRIFLIEAKIDDEKGYLVFDTGASGLVINKTYFRNHLVLDNQESNGVTGSVANVERVTVENLEIYGIQYKGVKADVTNLGHIENRRGVKVLGLLGFCMLKEFEIVFNPEENQLMLYRVDKKGERLSSSNSKIGVDYTSKFEFKNNILFLKTQVNGKFLRFCFDTGAETNVIDRNAPKSIINSINITRRSTLSGAGSSTSEVLFGIMNGFQIGSTTLDNLETIITNLDPLSEAYGTRIDGMLGYSFISKGIISINFVKQELSINYFKEGKNE